MNAPIRHLTFVGALLVAGNVSAALLTLENDHWWVSIDSDTTVALGTPELQGNSVVFRPGLQLSAPPNEQFYSDSRDFSVSLTFVAKPGYQIMGYGVQAAGTTYVGDDARLGVSGSFNQTFYGASYYSGALTGDGSWHDSFGYAGPDPLSISGTLYVETTNHYSYEQQVGVNEVPIYEYNYVDVLIGYTPIYDEEGNFVGENPLYETQYVETLVGYSYDPIYQTFYQTSGGDISLDELRIDVTGTVSAVPLPPATLLLASGLVAGWAATRRGRRPSRV